MGWIYLVIAGLSEIVWAVSLKYTEGLTKLYPSLLTIIFMGLSFFCLSQSLKTLPLGTAYTVWVGIGSVGTIILGMILFDESRDLMRIICLLLIVIGVVGLKLVTLDV